MTFAAWVPGARGVAPDLGARRPHFGRIPAALVRRDTITGMPCVRGHRFRAPRRSLARCRWRSLERYLACRHQEGQQRPPSWRHVSALPSVAARLRSWYLRAAQSSCPRIGYRVASTSSRDRNLLTRVCTTHGHDAHHQLASGQTLTGRASVECASHPFSFPGVQRVDTVVRYSAEWALPADGKIDRRTPCSRYYRAAGWLR
jgi:hypothetical protein